MESIRLRDIERRSWRAYQQDGLTDVQFGVLLLAGAVMAVLDHAAVPDWIRIMTLAVLALFGVGLVSWMRWRYVMPRLGRARFSTQRVRRTRTMRILLAACVLATVTLVVLTGLSPGLGIPMPGDLGAWLIISAVILVPITAIAVFLDCPRLLLYGALFAAVEFLHIVVRLPQRVPFAAVFAYGGAACIAFGIGGAIYIHFLRTVARPVLREEGEEGRRDRL
ncbi:MAG: hypothetical protein AB7V19_08310 [Candidatus Bipolaricaulia bacterium]